MKNLNLILLATTTLTMIGCGSELKSASLASLDSALSTPVVNQAPQINCSVTNLSQSGQTRQLHTLSTMDTFFAQNPKQGDVLEFNCSQTSSAAGGIVLAMDSDYDPALPNFLDVSGQVFQITTNRTGSIPYAIRATDADGLTRIKTFTLIVQCPTTIMPAINLAGVSVSPAAKLNYFNYSVNMGDVSGGAGFQFSWDFNGDGAFDPFDMAQPNNVWTQQSSVSNIYTIFANNREIGLKVRNNCGYETAYKVSKSFVMNNIARTPSAVAVPKPYYYIQADIQGSLPDPRYNGDVLVTQYPGEAYERVICDYKFNRYGQPSVFTMKAFNWYAGSTKQDMASSILHGLNLRIEGIPDTGASGLQSYDEVQGVKVSSLTYLTSSAGDGFAANQFGKNSTACTVRIALERMQGVQPCAAGKTNQADFSEIDTLQMYGEYDCPTLVDSKGNTVAAKNGKFFCEKAPADQCFGGGGGGGGGIAPPAQ